jgi:hypothetical protein
MKCASCKETRIDETIFYFIHRDNKKKKEF